MRTDAIVALAQAAHRSHWSMTGSESEGDKRATLTTSSWQQAAVATFGAQLVPEFSIGDGLRERIDLVDREAGIAYELKVSPNNTHFEFYRDIFKVIIARDNVLPHLGRFVFVTPEVEAKRLERAFARAVVEHARSVGLAIEIRGI